MIFQKRHIGLETVCLTLACAALIAFPLSVAAQAPQPPQVSPTGEQPATAPTAQIPDPNYRPGFLDAVGRWLGASRQAIEGTQQRLGTLGSQATGAATDAAQAAGSAVGLQGNRIVTGRQICGVAPNGGADCQPAADTLCRSKGFAAGRSLDVRSARRCPSRVWISGYVSDNECRTETFVNRAVCQ